MRKLHKILAENKAAPLPKAITAPVARRTVAVPRMGNCMGLTGIAYRRQGQKLKSWYVGKELKLDETQ